MKRCKYFALVLATGLLAITSTAFPITGEEALAKFQGRMNSIRTMRGNISWTDESGFHSTPGTSSTWHREKFMSNFPVPPGR